MFSELRKSYSLSDVLSVISTKLSSQCAHHRALRDKFVSWIRINFRINVFKQRVKQHSTHSTNFDFRALQSYQRSNIVEGNLTSQFGSQL